MRLLAITMATSILLTALLGYWAVGLAPATALLLGAVLAPTDPVLAAEVQVGPPGGEPDEEDDLRFSLTSEAGPNDALAGPLLAYGFTEAVGGYGFLAVFVAAVALRAPSTATSATERSTTSRSRPSRC